MPRVLSVQSHVVFGVVGNKAAVFPLELRGFTVDPLNTCQLSNHTGYCSFAGSRTSADDLSAIWTSLESIGATDQYVGVLTGYVGRADVLAALVAKIVALRSARGAALTILCDPVCGDNGKLYVPEDVPPLYRELLRASTIATPNGFEAGLLSGVAPRCVESAKKCAEWFHGLGPRLVVITSIEERLEGANSDDITNNSGSGSGGSPSPRAEDILVVASYVPADGDERHPAITAAARVPRVEGKFSGTGDLFSALVLSEWAALEESRDLAKHLSRWCSTLHAVLTATKPGTIRQAAGFSELDVVGAQNVLKHGADGPVAASLV